MKRGENTGVIQFAYKSEELQDAIDRVVELLKDEKLTAHEPVKAALISTMVELLKAETMRFTTGFIAGAPGSFMEIGR